MKPVQLRQCPSSPSLYVTEDGGLYYKRRGIFWPRSHGYDPKGYIVYGCRWYGKVTTIGIHRFVMTAFGPPQPEGKPFVLHRDGNKYNNHISNLYWGTHRENMRDMVRHGTVSHGTHRPAAKLNPEKVAEIRRLRDTTDITWHALAAKFGIGKSTAVDAYNGRNWRRVPPFQSSRVNHRKETER